MDVADQTPDRVMVVTDENRDGNNEGRRHDTFEIVAGERLIVRSVFDEDTDSRWGWAEAYTHDVGNDNRLILLRIGAVDGNASRDPVDSEITYNKAERYHYDDAGVKTTVDYYDSWTDPTDGSLLGDNTADRPGEPYVPPSGRGAGEPGGAGLEAPPEHGLVGGPAVPPSYDDWGV